MTKKEFKVGEVFQCGLIKLKVEKVRCIASWCDGCFFHFRCFKQIVRTIAGPCIRTDREDKTDVVFKKVED